MTGISTEDVRKIVGEENQYIEKTMSRLAKSIDKMADAICELVSQDKANQEKFSRIHNRIEETYKLADSANRNILTVTTEIIPKLESQMAINTFSLNKIWKVALVILTPMIAGVWVLMERFNSLQADQISAITKSLDMLSQSLGLK